MSLFRNVHRMEHSLKEIGDFEGLLQRRRETLNGFRGVEGVLKGCRMLSLINLVALDSTFNAHF